MIRNRVVIGLLTIFCATSVGAENLRDIYSGGEFRVDRQDRDFAIQMIDAGAQMAKAGVSDVASKWQGYQIEAIQQFSSVGQLVPNAPVQSELLTETYGAMLSMQNGSSEFREKIAPQGTFADVLHFATDNNLLKEEAQSEAAAYVSFMRGVVLLNSQLDAQSQALRQVSQTDGFCWYPFCWAQAK